MYVTGNSIGLNPDCVTIKYAQTMDVRTGSMPMEYYLEQNYPNPFSATGGSAFGGNPTTTIAFTLPSQSEDYDEGRGRVGSHVTLRVYDMLGREVATLVSEEKQPGTYEVPFNAMHLSSGVYFYRLSVVPAGAGRASRQLRRNQKAFAVTLVPFQLIVPNPALRDEGKIIVGMSIPPLLLWRE